MGVAIDYHAVVLESAGAGNLFICFLEKPECLPIEYTYEAVSSDTMRGICPSFCRHTLDRKFDCNRDLGSLTIIKYQHRVHQLGAIDLAYSGRKPRNVRRDSQRNNRKETPRSAMLSISRLGGFKYDLKAIMRDAHLNESFAPSFLASVVAKASRISIQDAKTYVKEVEQNGMYSEAVAREICGLLDHYSKYR